MFVPCTSPALFVLEYNAAQARTGLAFAFLADCDRESLSHFAKKQTRDQLGSRLTLSSTFNATRSFDQRSRASLLLELVVRKSQTGPQ